MLLLQKQCNYRIFTNQFGIEDNRVNIDIPGTFECLQHISVMLMGNSNIFSGLCKPKSVLSLNFKTNDKKINKIIGGRDCIELICLDDRVKGTLKVIPTEFTCEFDGYDSRPRYIIRFDSLILFTDYYAIEDGNVIIVDK
jgi:hypothetical protein